MVLESALNKLDEVTLFTVGHSTRSAEEFIAILKAHQISHLIDVRSFPGSRRYPHFNKENLGDLLNRVNIEYLHMPQLGGRRRALPNSRNTAWKNSGFRGYADYMETDEFATGVEELLSIAKGKRTAVMCAEAVWWRCHRSLIADYLKAKGLSVVHLIGEKKAESHPYTTAARIVDGSLSYEGLLID